MYKVRKIVACSHCPVSVSVFYRLSVKCICSWDCRLLQKIQHFCWTVSEVGSGPLTLNPHLSTFVPTLPADWNSFRMKPGGYFFAYHFSYHAF